MSFVTDPIDHRTYDPARGFELFSFDGFNGETHYKLIRSDGAYVLFTTRHSFSMEECSQQRLPVPKVITHCVTSIRGRFPSRSRALTDAIIREALTAYKRNHGLPLECDVAVHLDQSVYHSDKALER